MALEIDSPQWWERQHHDPLNREFEHDESGEFLENLMLLLGDFLSPCNSDKWTLQPFTEAWARAREISNLLKPGLDRAAAMVVAREWDPTPLVWARRYFRGAVGREIAKVDELRYLLSRLYLAETGKAEQQLREYDELAASSLHPSRGDNEDVTDGLTNENSTGPSKFESEDEIPAEYRVNASPSGEVLVPTVIRENYGLTSTDLSRKCRAGRVKWRKKFVYRHSVIAVAADAKRS